MTTTSRTRQTQATAPVPPEDTRQWRREALIVVALTVVAAVPRFWAFGREGLTHFDEGVYAAAGAWSLAPGGLAALDPGLIPYAPAGLPVLIGLAYALLGLSDASALLVTAACGVLTVPAAAWVGRRTFGPGAGAGAAALAALSLAHVAFSRKALTDVPFLLAWLVAVGLGGRFLERPRPGRAVAFGLAVGLAQNVKYNGWVAGLVVVVAALAGLLADAEARRPRAVARTFGLGVVAALVAGLAYLPWFWFVQEHGGYAALLRHHRRYAGGLGSWLPQWRAQLAQVVALSGGMLVGAVAWATAWLGAGVAVQGAGWFFPRDRWDAARLRLGLLLGAAALATVPCLPWWAGLAWSGWLLVDPRPAPRVLGAWWLVLSVLTPFYHPYARLWLPLHAAGWVLLAGGIVALGPFPGSALEVSERAIFANRRALTQGAVALLCLVLARAHWRPARPRPLALAAFFAPTDGFRSAVATLRTTPPLAGEPEAPLLVLARRPVAYYLGVLTRHPIRLLADGRPLRRSGTAGADWALVDGAMLGAGTVDGEIWGPILNRWSRVTDWPLRFDPVVLLDVNPDAPYDLYEADPFQLRLLVRRGSPSDGPRPIPGPNLFD